MREHIADESDRATLNELISTQESIARIMANTPKAPPDWDKKTCYECEADLPIERIKANRYLCVMCKTIEERKGAQR